MNTSFPDSNPVPIVPRRKKWGVVKVGFLVALALFCSWTVYGMVFNGDIKSARRAAVQSVPGEWDKRFDMGIGPVILGFARTVVSFIDAVPPEARVALRSVKGAGVSIYHLRDGAERPTREAVLVNADRALARRGWERLVGVTSGQDVVAIYTPANMKSVEDAAVCVLVNNGRELVVVSARANLDEIMLLAMDRLNEEKWRFNSSGSPFRF
jgi:hypothetical protein